MIYFCKGTQTLLPLATTPCQTRKKQTFLPVILSESLNNHQWVTVLTLAWGSSRWGEEPSLQILLDKCWADGQPPFPPCKVVWYKGCLRLGVQCPTQGGLNARGLLGFRRAVVQADSTSSTILWDDQWVIRPQTSLNVFLICYI